MVTHHAHTRKRTRREHELDFILGVSTYLVVGVLFFLLSRLDSGGLPILPVPPLLCLVLLATQRNRPRFPAGFLTGYLVNIPVTLSFAIAVEGGMGWLVLGSIYPAFCGTPLWLLWWFAPR